MKHYLKQIALGGSALLLYTHCGTGSATTGSENLGSQPSAPLKIISIGGTLSEIVCELGSCDQIIAADKTSTRPKTLQELPSVGYRTGIKAEGVLSLEADMVLAEEGYVNPEVVTQLESTSLKVYTFKHEHTTTSTKRLINEIGAILEKEKEAKMLVEALDADLAELNSLVAQTTSQPSVLFVFARGMGSLSICGKNTFAEQLVSMTGARFPVEEVFDFKPLTPEGLVAANPDYILFFESGLETLGGVEGALQIPGIMQTTAGQKKQLIAMDGLWLSGFGPNVGKAAMHLAKAIYPELSSVTQATAP